MSSRAKCVNVYGSEAELNAIREAAAKETRPYSQFLMLLGLERAEDLNAGRRPVQDGGRAPRRADGTKTKPIPVYGTDDVLAKLREASGLDNLPTSRWLLLLGMARAVKSGLTIPEGIDIPAELRI